MQALIEFLATYQPQYADIVQGYPEDQIERLEQMLGRSAPAAYRDFLSTAAANLGFTVDLVTFALDEVLDLAEAKHDSMPANLYPIAVQDDQPGIDYYLDISRAPHDGDGMVVGSAAGSLAFDDVEPKYPSLRDMLFSKGFREVRMLTLPHRQWIDWELEPFQGEAQAVQRDRLDAILNEFGLARLPVTSDAMALYDRGDLAAMVIELTRVPGFIVMFAAEDQEEVMLVAETVSDSMPGDGACRPW